MTDTDKLADEQPCSTGGSCGDKAQIMPCLGCRTAAALREQQQRIETLEEQLSHYDTFEEYDGQVYRRSAPTREDVVTAAEQGLDKRDERIAALKKEFVGLRADIAQSECTCEEYGSFKCPRCLLVDKSIHRAEALKDE